jgi:hypothetical protein
MDKLRKFKIPKKMSGQQQQQQNQVVVNPPPPPPQQNQVVVNPPPPPPPQQNGMDGLSFSYKIHVLFLLLYLFGAFLEPPFLPLQLLLQFSKPEDQELFQHLSCQQVFTITENV